MCTVEKRKLFNISFFIGAPCQIRQETGLLTSSSLTAILASLMVSTHGSHGRDLGSTQDVKYNLGWLVN